MKKGIVVSDIHAGSIYGMLPPGFKDFNGEARQQNAGQRYLWDCWLDACARAKRFDADFVIVNGDVVDGPQRRSEGAELALIAPSDQARAAIETLRLLRAAVPRAKFYFTKGTPYHVGNWGDAEESVAAELQGQEYTSVGTGKRCWEVLWLSTEGVVIEAAHHIGVATGFYRLTPLDKEMQWSSMAGKDETRGVPKADLLIRSHVHYFSRGEHASKEGITTPCWQLQTRYMRKASTYRMLPDIGIVLLEIDGQAKKTGETPCRIRKELYSLPPVPVTRL